jgi:hypothetical protein
MGDNVFDPDPSAMVAAMNHLTGLIQGLQGELHQVRAQLAQGTSPVQAAPSTSLVPAGVPTAHAVDSSQVTGKLNQKPLVPPSTQVQWTTSCLNAGSISLACVLQLTSKSSLHRVCLMDH